MVFERITADSAIAGVTADILQPLNEKRWGRSWEASELLDLATAFEERVGGVG